MYTNVSSVILFYYTRKEEKLVFCYQTTVRKICSSDQEKLLKFQAEGLEFAKKFRSLEQFVRTVKGQNNFW